MADIVKKYLFQGHSIDRGKLRDELGDVLWYAMLIRQTMGFSLDDFMIHDIKKLHKRYPNGFESARSIQRETTQEGKSRSSAPSNASGWLLPSGVAATQIGFVVAQTSTTDISMGGVGYRDHSFCRSRPYR